MLGERPRAALRHGLENGTAPRLCLRGPLDQEQVNSYYLKTPCQHWPCLGPRPKVAALQPSDKLSYIRSKAMDPVYLSVGLQSLYFCPNYGACLLSSSLPYINSRPSRTSIGIALRRETTKSHVARSPLDPGTYQLTDNVSTQCAQGTARAKKTKQNCI